MGSKGGLSKSLEKILDQKTFFTRGKNKHYVFCAIRFFRFFIYREDIYMYFFSVKTVSKMQPRPVKDFTVYFSAPIRGC